MKIRSQFGNYEVTFGPHEDFLESKPTRRDTTARLIDENVAKLYPSLTDSLSDPLTFVVAASEEAKTFEALGEVYKWLSAIGVDRSWTIQAIGGGTVQDITCFAVATYKRGIPWTFLPTTLLAQSDSCIGGKCGINFGRQKNQIGLVYPPKSIIIDLAFNDTLSDVDTVNGLGEIFKQSLIGREHFFKDFEAVLTSEMFDLTHSRDWVLPALKSKKWVIEKDEMERNFRRVLNLGHTFGHAIESASGFRIPHGVAVIMGIRSACIMAELRGVGQPSFHSRVRDVCDHLLAYNPGSLEFDVEAAISAVGNDKKNHSGRAVFVLCDRPGKTRFESLTFGPELTELLGRCFGSA